jgi:hypothetical protein
MTLNRCKVIENWKRENLMALCGEMALKGSVECRKAHCRMNVWGE